MAVRSTEGTAGAGEGSNAALPTLDQAFNRAVEEGAGGESDAGDGDTESGEEDQTSEDTDEGAGHSDETPEATADDKDEKQEATGADDEAESEGGEGATDEEAVLIAQLPPALRKQWHRVFSQKSQGIAGDRKLIEALRSNPERAARRILEKIEADKKAAGEITDDATPQITRESLVADYLKIKGVTKDQAEALADVQVRSLEAAVAPLRTRLEQSAVKAEADLIDRELNAFKKDHPEFDEIESDISAMMGNFPVRGEGLSYRSYLDHMHALVMQNKSVADRVKKVTEKIKKNATEAARKSKSKPVQDGAVKPGPPAKLPTLNEAFDAAGRGEVYGKGISKY